MGEGACGVGHLSVAGGKVFVVVRVVVRVWLCVCVRFVAPAAHFVYPVRMLACPCRRLVRLGRCHRPMQRWRARAKAEADEEAEVNERGRTLRAEERAVWALRSCDVGT